jgi:hypothetical protein
MARALNREKLLAAFDEIGRAAVAAGQKLQIAVYGGSALMLASNFRFATEDVDVSELEQPWPAWLSETVGRLATQNGWSEHWLNDAVSFHLSPLADPARDIVPFGNFPRRADEVGLVIFVPTARYLLALKLKALRVSDATKGSKDLGDVAGLLGVLGITDVEPAIGVLAEYFPKSAADADKQRFVLRHILASQEPGNAPRYPRRDD